MIAEHPYAVLVVEDEKIIREGIAGSLEEGSSFSVYTAENGERGMAILEERTVHGIILDIKMPGMNGLELLEWIRERNLNAAIFILSGYDDFSYVQRALQAGADDYILKPATPEKIKEISERLLARIEEKEKVFADWREMEKRAEESRKLLKDRFFMELIEALPDERTWNEKTEYLGLFCGDPEKEYSVAVLELDAEGIREKYSRRERIYQVMIQKIEAFIAERCEARRVDWFHIRGAVFALLFSGGDPSDFAGILQDELESRLSVRLSAGIGNSSPGTQGIRESYRQATYALQYKIVLGKHGIYRFSDLKPQLPDVSGDIDGERFELCVRTGRIDEAREMINDSLDLYEKSHDGGAVFPLYTRCLKYISHLLGVAESFEPATSTGKPDPFPIGNPRQIVNGLFEMDSIRAVRDYLLDLTQRAGDTAEANKKDKHGSIVEGIKKIIREKYAEDLDNRIIAAEMGVSPNYAGQVFIKETGKTIKEYLAVTRVEAAKKLLKNSRRMIYEVAFRTGFKDEHYFSSVFKGITGMSPSEYREL